MDASPLADLDARFDHVAVAAPSIESMLPLYRDILGGRLASAGRNVVLGFRTVEVVYPDGRHVELLAPVEGSTFLDSFLARTGGRGGLHHITFLVASVQLALDVLHARGYATFGERPDDPEWAEAFVHPRDAGGVLLQVAHRGVAGEVPDAGSQWVNERVPSPVTPIASARDADGGADA